MLIINKNNTERTHFCFNFIIEKLLFKLGQSIIGAIVVEIQWVEHISAINEIGQPAQTCLYKRLSQLW